MNRVVNKIQQVLFILLGITIPTSIAITNLVIGLLALCWIIEGDFKNKFKTIKASKWMLSIFALIALYGLGMLWGNTHLNAEWQFQRLALLLVFPILKTIAISQLTIKRSVMAFLGTAFISALAAILINNKIIKYMNISDYAECFNTTQTLLNIDLYTPFNFDDLLVSRHFNAVIYREENVNDDRSIADYKPNNALDQLLEAERVKEKIRDYEHDMWNY